MNSGKGSGSGSGSGSGRPVLGEAVLFFGCRNRGEDYLYEEELTAAARTGALTGLHTAFSREGAQKVYVQHVIEERGEEVWQLLGKEDVRVFVCGATAMGVDVMAAFQKVCLCSHNLTCSHSHFTPPPPQFITRAQPNLPSLTLPPFL